VPNHTLEGLPLILQRIYTARGIQTISELERGLAHLLPYQALQGIDEAAKCLANAIMLNKRILIIGDFDADGATSTALAVSAFYALGAKQVNYIVPNRFEYGYGLTPEIVAVASQQAPDVIVTVDNGISSHAGVLAAKALGIQVVITDHHLPAADLPLADAIVNPQQKNDLFASKCLAGVGVIFYVILALRNELRQQNWYSMQNMAEPNMAQFLDLVALGTVADLVPLDRNNRILVHQGLQRIQTGKTRPGILALLAVANRQADKLNASDLGFAIAPRLNAAGRLTDMSVGIECLLSQDEKRAYQLASQLNVLNEERRHIERDMQQQAFATLDKLAAWQKEHESLPAGICLFDENWHQGVIGLLAARIKERFHRPSVIFAPGNTPEELKGSARSIPGLHIRDIFDAIAARNPSLINKFGGHAMAAGLSIHRDCYKDFCEAFIQEVELHLGQAGMSAELLSDGEIEYEQLNNGLAELLREAGPWGQGFPEPLFDGRFYILHQTLVGGKHLKLTLNKAYGDVSSFIEAIAFNIDVNKWPNHRATQVHAAYRLDINEYQGRKKLQLVIEQLEVITS
jgi:single-stranded-DNA-specific exonuclease